MTKKIIALVLAVTMCAVLVLTGCGSSAPAASSAAPADSGSTAPSATVEATTDNPIEIKVAAWDSPASPSGISVAKAVEMMNEKGEGRINATCYLAETLLTSTDHLTGTAQGLADIAYWQVDLVPGTTPLASMFTLPYTQDMPLSQGMTNAMRDVVLTENSVFQQEMEAMNLHWITVKAPDGMGIHITKDKPIYEMSDLQGLKLIGLAEMQPYVEMGGGNIVPMSPADYYTSIEKGVVDGTLNHFALASIFTYWEVTKSHTSYGTSQGLHNCSVGFVANNQFWNSLPEDIKDIITECLQWSEDDMIAQDKILVEDLFTKLEETNQPIYQVNDEDMSSWYEAGSQIVEEWLAGMEGDYPEIRAAYAQYMELCQKYIDVS